MNRKTIFKMLAAAMLMPTMLLTTACSNSDDEIINTEIPTNTKGYALPVTINVTRQGDTTTRATYTDNGNKTGSLSFSTGDKLFVTGTWDVDEDNYYCYAGILDYVSDGTFSGTIITQTEWTGTIEGLLGGASANLLPAGYKEYGYLSIEEEGTYDAYLSENSNKAFATSKATAVEQFSYEYDNSYSSGFALGPCNAILNFTINGLDASTEVDVSFSYPNYPDPIVISGKVTTDGDGTATFAIGIKYGNNLENCTLTVDGNAIALPDKTVAYGKIYNISRSVAPAGPVTYAELNGGEVLHVGDIFNLSERIRISFKDGEYYMGSYGSPYTVVRADLTQDEWEDIVVNEKPDGKYYVIKPNVGDYYDFGGTLGVTDTSDGILVTYNGIIDDIKDYTFTVHNP